jgi:drug/metabolite transporter (DMT)-like permease
MLENTPLINNNNFKSGSGESLGSSSANGYGVNIEAQLSSDELIKCRSTSSTSNEIAGDGEVPVIRGIIDMFLSCFSFAVENLVTKMLLNGGFEVPQLLLVRSALTAVCITSYAYYSKLPGGPFGPRQDRYWLHFHGITGAIYIMTFFLSLQNLELGDALALSFITPVIMPIVSAVWVGEDYRPLDAGAAFTAMTGVIFISKPEFLFGSGDSDGGSSKLGIACSIVAAMFASVSNISLRKISKKSSSMQVVNYMMLWMLPVSIGMLAYKPELFKFEIDYIQVIQLATLILTSFLGQYWLGTSLLTTPARFVSPIIFTKVFYAYINQYLFWGVAPSYTSTVGVILVACSLALLSFKI